MIRFRSLTTGVAAAFLALGLSVAQLSAQGQRQRGPGNRGQDRAELEQRVRARFGQMVALRLGLDEAQARRLGDAMEGFRQDREDLFRDEQALRLRLEAVLTEADPSEDEAVSLLERMGELRDREAGLFKAEQEALLEILTPVQLVRFHAMREQLTQRVQQLRGGPGPPGGRRPGGPGDPGGVEFYPW